MDLRIVKTKKGIREAFLRERANEPLEKVKVQNLCALALVNKTTFYKYYSDVFVLAEELEQDAVALLVDRLREKDCLLTDPQRFVTELLKAMETHRTLLLSLFRDRPDALFSKLGARLAQDCESAARARETAQSQPLLAAFAVGGLLRALQASGAWPDELSCADDSSAKAGADSSAATADSSAENSTHGAQNAQAAGDALVSQLASILARL